MSTDCERPHQLVSLECRLTEELIRDRSIISLKDHSTKLSEEILDLNKALNICCSNEVGSQQLKAMNLAKKTTTEEVCVVKDPRDGQKRNKDQQVTPRSDKIKRQNKRIISALIVEVNRHKLENCPAFGCE